MQTYFFLLGSTPLLSSAELSSVCVGKEIKSISTRLRSVELEDDQAAKDVFEVLGGSIKLFKTEKTYKELKEQELLNDITKHLLDLGKKPHFSFMHFGNPEFEIDTRDIKKELKDNGMSSRYTESSGEIGVSAAILLHNENVVELATIETEDHSYLVRTIAIQNIDDWTKRDRGKPYFDRKKGMLPPKVARMMVNLGLGALEANKDQNEGSEKSSLPLLFDPFCGTGTVLIEGLFREINVIGSDLDLSAVQGSKNNLNWLNEEYEVNTTYDVLRSDVTQVHKLEKVRNIDLIVTEPFLGKPNPQQQQLDNIFRGLTKMYLGAFNAWTKVLKPGGVVVIVFPLVEMGERVFSLEKLIDKLASKGYTPLVKPPLMYARPRAIVQRQIQVFRFDPK